MKRIEEPEFIVSSEELRKNRERALLREELEREEKKNKIELIGFVVIAIIVITVGLIVLHKMNDKAVDNCINNGGSASFCNAHLRG